MVSKLVRQKFLLTILIAFFLIWPLGSRAQVGLPFGGKIVMVLPCLFSGGNLLIKQIPVAGSPVLLFRPGISKLYPYFQLTPGVHILGNTLGADVCILSIIPPIIIPAPLITIIGTSGLAGMVAGGGGGSSSGDNGGDGQNPADNDSQTNQNQGNQGNVCSGSGAQSGAYIIANEGFRNNMYVDSMGNRTIGVGHLVPDNAYMPAHLSDSQVTDLYNADLATAQSGAAASAARHGVDWNNLSPARQTVLTDMAFNMGASGGQGLDGFNRMWSAIGRGDWSTAGAEVSASQYGSGQVGDRSSRNAAIMANNDDSAINQRINSDPRARNFCNTNG